MRYCRRVLHCTDTASYSVPSVLTVAGLLVRAVSAVVSAVAPGVVFDAAPIEAAPVTLFTATICCSEHITPTIRQPAHEETQTHDRD